jgi:hypothetical protein
VLAYIFSQSPLKGDGNMVKHVGNGLAYAALIGIAMFWSCGEENPVSGGGGGLPGTWDVTKTTMNIGGTEITITASNTTMQQMLELKNDQTYYTIVSTYDDQTNTMESDTDSGTWSTSGSSFSMTSNSGGTSTGPYTQSGNDLSLTISEDDGMGGTMTMTMSYKRR